MTTPGNNGANTPEDDDPFGYLYADGQAQGGNPPRTGGGYGYPGPTVGQQQPGVPRTSYNQVRTVGERQYGQVPQQQYQGPPQQQGPPAQQYGQPTAQYAAPETYPGGAPPRQGPPPQQTGGGGRGPNTKGLLIGAVAVVAAVVIGIAVALASNSGDKDKKDDTASPGKSSSGQASQQPSTDPSASASAPADLPKDDAATLTLGGSAQVGTNVPGAKGTGGAFVGNFNNVGASVTWKPNVPKAGSYKLNLQYGIPGVDANATITTNGKAESRPMNMKNFAHSPAGDWAKGWQTTYAIVQLNKGANEIKLSCEQGNQCNFNLDQVWLTPAS
ncbi:CBM35 domain-containing protein [Streptomyces sp. NPDC001415]